MDLGDDHHWLKILQKDNLSLCASWRKSIPPPIKHAWLRRSNLDMIKSLDLNCQFIGNIRTKEQVKATPQGYNQQSGNVGSSSGQTTYLLQLINCKIKTKLEGKPVVCKILKRHFNHLQQRTLFGSWANKLLKNFLDTWGNHTLTGYCLIVRSCGFILSVNNDSVFICFKCYLLEIHAEIFRLNDKIPRTASEQSTLSEWEIQMKQDWSWISNLKLNNGILPLSYYFCMYLKFSIVKKYVEIVNW